MHDEYNKIYRKTRIIILLHNLFYSKASKVVFVGLLKYDALATTFLKRFLCEHSVIQTRGFLLSEPVQQTVCSWAFVNYYCHGAAARWRQWRGAVVGFMKGLSGVYGYGNMDCQVFQGKDAKVDRFLAKSQNT